MKEAILVQLYSGQHVFYTAAGDMCSALGFESYHTVPWDDLAILAKAVGLGFNYGAGRIDIIGRLGGGLTWGLEPQFDKVHKIEAKVTDAGVLEFVVWWNDETEKPSRYTVRGDFSVEWTLETL